MFEDHTFVLSAGGLQNDPWFGRDMLEHKSFPWMLDGSRKDFLLNKFWKLSWM